MGFTVRSSAKRFITSFMLFRCHNCKQIVEVPVRYAQKDKYKTFMLQHLKLTPCPNCKDKVYKLDGEIFR